MEQLMREIFKNHWQKLYAFNPKKDKEPTHSNSMTVSVNHGINIHEAMRVARNCGFKVERVQSGKQFGSSFDLRFVLPSVPLRRFHMDFIFANKAIMAQIPTFGINGRKRLLPAHRKAALKFLTSLSQSKYLKAIK